jgi:hypothetical protein
MAEQCEYWHGGVDGVRCEDEAVERLYYLHGAYDLAACAKHLEEHPAHILDVKVGHRG